MLPRVAPPIVASSVVLVLAAVLVLLVVILYRLNYLTAMGIDKNLLLLVALYYLNLEINAPPWSSMPVPIALPPV